MNSMYPKKSMARKTLPKPAQSKPAKSDKATPGPKPDTLKIDGNWEDAGKKSFAKKKPAAGWPK